MSEITHLNKKGEAIMVDISQKDKNIREAIAEGLVLMKKETLKKIIEKGIPKGDVLSVARIAGIMGAKKTSQLIPLCHPIGIDSITIDFLPNEEKGELRVICKAKTTDKTGVEMEAMTGVSIAALTIYDMCKGVEKGIEIDSIRLLKKTGGKSGTYTREVK